jgi:hypothetical protein
MTARDLAIWDISTIDQTILKPASYRVMQTDTLLTNGVTTGYGLGVQVGVQGGRRSIAHTGEVSGFTASNRIYPDDRAAIVVLTNLDATGASSQILNRIAPLLFKASTTDKDAAAALAKVKSIFEGLQHGRVDRTLFTAMRMCTSRTPLSLTSRPGSDRSVRRRSSSRPDNRCAAVWSNGRSASSAAGRTCV